MQAMGRSLAFLSPVALEEGELTHMPLMRTHQSGVPDLVYVHLGQSLPGYALHSLAIARKNFKGEIFLLRDQPEPFNIPGISVVEIGDWYDPSSFEAFRRLSPLNPFFREGFWLKAVERIFVIQQFQEKHDLVSFFHAELDVLILNLDDFHATLEASGEGLFAPVQNSSRAIASLVYVHGFKALRELLEFLNQHSHLGNEMKILGAFFEKRPDIAHPIMCEADIENTDIDKSSGVEAPQLVDGLGFGPWIFGYDPRNLRGISFNHYKENGLRVNFKGLKFRPIRGSMLGVFRNGKHVASVRTLHVHSKIFRQLRKPLILRLYFFLAGIPFKIPLKLNTSSLVEHVASFLLSKPLVGALRMLPRFCQHIYAYSLIDLLGRQHRVISNRERSFVVDMLPKLPTRELMAISEEKSHIVTTSSSSGRPSAFRAEIKALPSTQKEEFELSLATAEFLLESDGVFQVVSGQAEVYCQPIAPSVKIPLVVSAIKRFQDFQHAQAYWGLSNSSYPASFAANTQVYYSRWVRRMFPKGLIDVHRWAELALKSARPTLSLAESYGNWVLVHERGGVQLFGECAIQDSSN